MLPGKCLNMQVHIYIYILDVPTSQFDGGVHVLNNFIKTHSEPDSQKTTIVNIPPEELIKTNMFLSFEGKLLPEGSYCGKTKL